VNRHTSRASLFTTLLQRDTVKALTLTQPWSCLMALGAKGIETRSWSTEYRGPLAIHAAKGFPRAAQALCEKEPFQQMLSRGGYTRHSLSGQNAWRLPLGQIVAIGLLDEVQRITPDFAVEEPERSFGDYTPGRFAWRFSSIYRLHTPVMASGSLGVWTWQPPTSFWLEVQEQLEKEQGRSLRP
jgi:activating signal cointegrator 1